jgi:phospholipid transport system substrate-binding protein
MKKLYWLVLILILPCGLVWMDNGLVKADSSLIGATTNTKINPKALIARTVDGIIKIVSEYPETSRAGVRRDKLFELIEPHFDFKEMSRRSLGSHWNSITEPQKVEFVSVFSDLLAKTYLSYLETVKPGMVAVLSEEIKPSASIGSYGVAVVKTDVKHKGEVFPIHYKLVERSNGWKVYDIVIENIGLVSNYRSEFAGVLRKDGFDGLIDRLRKKKSK